MRWADLVEQVAVAIGEECGWLRAGNDRLLDPFEQRAVARAAIRKIQELRLTAVLEDTP